MKAYKILNAYWDSKKGTRLGQAYGLLVIGFIFGLFVAAKLELASVARRLAIGVGSGLALGVILILVMLVPSMWLERIRMKEKRGESAVAQRILLVLYFFPFLTFLSLAVLGLVMSQF